MFRGAVAGSFQIQTGKNRTSKSVLIFLHYRISIEDGLFNKVLLQTNMNDETHFQKDVTFSCPITTAVIYCSEAATFNYSYQPKASMVKSISSAPVRQLIFPFQQNLASPSLELHSAILNNRANMIPLNLRNHFDNILSAFAACFDLAINESNLSKQLFLLNLVSAVSRIFEAFEFLVPYWGNKQILSYANSLKDCVQDLTHDWAAFTLVSTKLSRALKIKEEFKKGASIWLPTIGLATTFSKVEDFLNQVQFLTFPKGTGKAAGLRGLSSYDGAHVFISQEPKANMIENGEHECAHTFVRYLKVRENISTFELVSPRENSLLRERGLAVESGQHYDHQVHGIQHHIPRPFSLNLVDEIIIQ